MWTVQEAKAKLSEVLKRAKQGEPQVIGAQDLTQTEPEGAF
jgi:antitoxin (DNA-binding transcriptional repressor) of toxin-antitoxin stability system